ncbi:MAG: IS256 family transposase [Planctomycetota bacterium]
MAQDTPIHSISQAQQAHDVLQEIARWGARVMLTSALRAEVDSYVAQFEDLRDEQGRRLVVRNGTCPERNIQTTLGPIPVARPRVNDRRVAEDGTRFRFTSHILPPYLRESKTLEDLIPWLYLRGISTGDFSEALAALVGKDAPSLSASTVVRLKKSWEEEYNAWRKRDLSNKRYAYIWADGIHFNIRLEEGRQCILVLMGATEDGFKEIIAVQDGVRESEQSWRELLLQVKAQGLTIDPKLAIADGALGFWKALPQVWPDTRPQRCWVHKTANILNRLPKSSQPAAKAAIQDIWMAGSRALAEKALATFVETWSAKHPRAVECLLKDKDELFTFYDFPAEHWRHLRTTNPIESTFATVRLRTKRTKGSGSRAACLAMVFKLAQSAQASWRKLNGYKLLADVFRGVPFKHGIKAGAA